MKDFKKSTEKVHRESARNIAKMKLQQIHDKGYVSDLAMENPHIKGWRLIGIGCIRHIIEYEHEFIGLIKDEDKERIGK